MNERNQRYRLWFALLSVFCLLILARGQTFAQAVDGADDVIDAPEALAPLCRMGVNVNGLYREPGIDGFETAPLRIGWYINYHTGSSSTVRPQGMKFTPVIRLVQEGPDEYSTKPTGAALEEAIRAHAGKGFAWVIGNEPDRPGVYQDDMLPELYARAYHELRAQIKAIDPSARVLAGSIVQATPVRMKYLDLILAGHQSLYGEAMEVDGWAIHGFILNEVSCSNNPDDLPCWGAEIPPGVNDSTGLVIDVQDNDDFDIFRVNIVRMRQWMADNGYRNTPLYLSEYGVLMPSGIGFSPDFTPERVNEFMTQTFDLIYKNGVDPAIGYPLDGNRLVQYLSWYSTSGKYDASSRDGEFNGYLFDPDRGYALSPMGVNYRDYAATIGDELDFLPLSFSLGSPFVVVGDLALIAINVEVANGGNNLYPVETTVRLYEGDPADGNVMGEGIAAVSGCGERATARITLVVPWNDGAPANMNVTAVVNPDGVQNEADRDDNTISGLLDFSGAPAVFPIGSIFLPLLHR
ncbi:MAG: hypothetical protein H6642_14210 [Caldilineaceae bacterium]|nr:hypothetical protein [Caldilineaceae bacterium]